MKTKEIKKSIANMASEIQIIIDKLDYSKDFINIAILTSLIERLKETKKDLK